MPRACAICGKTATYGYNVSHSKVHTHRRFDANLHPAVIDGAKLLVCTRCRRTQTKDARMAKKRERAPLERLVARRSAPLAVSTPSVWQHQDFRKLWVGQTISQLGSVVTRTAVPLVALLV